MFLVVSARATTGACELLQRFVALFGFNWRSFSGKKLRRFDQVWMKFYILNMSLRADTDEKMRCMCEICIHEYISIQLVISVIFEVSSVLRNFSTLPVSCPGNSGTVGSSVMICTSNGTLVGHCAPFLGATGYHDAFTKWFLWFEVP